MNAPFAFAGETIAIADLSDPGEVARIERFVARAGGTPFHRPAWLCAVEKGTGQSALGLVAEKDGLLTGWLPLTEVHSPLFPRALVSSGFAVGGGALARRPATAHRLCAAARELASRRACASVELRGGEAPDDWPARTDSHAGFAAPLAANDEAQLLAIPRKQRAEIRKGLANDFTVEIGTSERDRSAHYAVYAESVRNLGTPVFPRSLFEAVLDAIDADILTLRLNGTPIASVLSLYHAGAVMPYWGGGTFAARSARANERMYFELMRHARDRGCETFDFGRSKVGSGAFAYKKNWGFEPRPLAYATWKATGTEARDVDPTSEAYSAKIALWKRLPLSIANRARAADRAGSCVMGETLFIAHRIPFPPDRGDKIRSHHLLKALASLGPVHVATLGETAADFAAEPLLAEVAATHCLARRPMNLPLAGVRAMLARKPVSLTAFDSAVLRRRIARTLDERPIDTIFVFSGQMGQYVPAGFTGRVIVDLCDVDSAKFEAYARDRGGARGWIDAREAELLAAEEARLVARADTTLLASEAEADLLRNRVHVPGADIRAVDNGIDSAFFDPGCRPTSSRASLSGRSAFRFHRADGLSAQRRRGGSGGARDHAAGAPTASAGPLSRGWPGAFERSPRARRSERHASVGRSA